MLWFLYVGGAMHEITEGDAVCLAAYGGEQIVRRVVAVMGDVVMVSKDEEITEARSLGRKPLTVGFPITCVLDVVEPRERGSHP